MMRKWLKDWLRGPNYRKMFDGYPLARLFVPSYSRRLVYRSTLHQVCSHAPVNAPNVCLATARDEGRSFASARVRSEFVLRGRYGSAIAPGLHRESAR